MKAVKMKSGNWRCRAFVGRDENGKQIFKSFTAPTKKEAEYMACSYIQNHKDEKIKSMTVGETIEKYIESKSNILSPTTIEGYKKIRRNHLQQLMPIKVDKLTQQEVQKAVNEESIRLSPKTVICAHGLMISALKVYYPQITFNTTLPKVQKKFKDLPDAVDVIKAVQGSSVELPAMLGIWLGLRMSEIRGIRKCDISPDGYLTVQNVVVRVNGEDVSKNQTKTVESTRRLKIPSPILEMINQTETESDTETIVKGSGSAIGKRFKTILKKHNVKTMTFHDLRHLNASVMLMLGVPDKYAMERGGWSTPNIMKSVYQHTFSSERKEVDRRIDEYFQQIVDHFVDTK